jgi:hypothetical protein
MSIGGSFLYDRIFRERKDEGKEDDDSGMKSPTPHPGSKHKLP